MTPAINILDKQGIEYHLHQYTHDPDCHTYGEEAVTRLGLDPAKVFKTLVAELDGGKLIVSVIPVSKMLDLKTLAKKAGAKKAKMADKKDVERTTGYIVGGVSPIGQKKRLAALIDESARQFGTIFISGGRRGLDIELSPEDLSQLTGASFAVISR
jgi:Cys-tRNA(Pro)/Cys-tRNA(Cys) deacylase